jgi:hypothetical protein
LLLHAAAILVGLDAETGDEICSNGIDFTSFEQLSSVKTAQTA